MGRSITGVSLTTFARGRVTTLLDIAAISIQFWFTSVRQGETLLDRAGYTLGFATHSVVVVTVCQSEPGALPCTG